MSTAYPPLPDQHFREAAVRERERNVLVDAGAGTGKTTLIIERVVEMVSPTPLDVPPVPLDRIAVITFTRRAAGELRYRLRQRLLETLATTQADETRAGRLREALGAVDTAYVGTIHSFADRLLRLRPVEARISPAYEIAEDVEDLVHETFKRLLRAAERATLAEELADHAPTSVPITEVEETLCLFHSVGLRLTSVEYEWGIKAGLDYLVRAMINARDVRHVPDRQDPSLATLRGAAARIASEIGTPSATLRGGRWLRRIADLLREIAEVDELSRFFRLAHEALGRSPDYTMKADCGGKGHVWECVKNLRNDGQWRAELLDPLQQWMGRRVARCQEAVVALYERVKAERGVLDQLDLIVKLRDLLRSDTAARKQLQGLFDHVLVDEFQDTDPLQCEIVFFLCEMGTAAGEWREVTLRPGSLTVVGDPKQSIYRFRRADILMYADAHEHLRAQGALAGSLTTNFRSRPGLVQLVNEQFERALGPADPSGDNRFDRDTGTVRYERIAPSPAIVRPPSPSLRAIPYAGASGEALNAEVGRDVEAAALAAYVRHLVESGYTIRDPEAGSERAVRYGDVVVLAPVTSAVPRLLRAFDLLGIRYSAHGGTLFLSTPLVRQYMLGLRAIADRDDGVAEAALLRPPFFALDLVDILSPQLDGDGPEVLAPRERLQAAQNVVRALRRDRFSRPPLSTAIDLIEHTALGRTAVTGPNGLQALDALYEIAYQLGSLASTSGIDFDAATAILRHWVDSPVQLDPPHTSNPEVVRVMTIHQAKGLEFPVVVLWDGFAEENGRVDATWVVPRDGSGIALKMDGLATEVPGSGRLLQKEKELATSERRRLFYVAMTRARDLLVLPEPASSSPGNKMLPALMGNVQTDLVERVEPYRPDVLPSWALPAVEHISRLLPDEVLESRTIGARTAFDTSIADTAAPLAVPVSVTTLAHEPTWTLAPSPNDEERDSEGAEREEKSRGSRFGTTFGSTVHRAIQLGLTGARGGASEWVTMAASENGLKDHLTEAEADVERAIRALQPLGLRDPGVDVQVEYPVCALDADGRLLNGYIDCVIQRANEILVIDFKTDTVSTTNVGLAAFPAYARQIALYGELMSRSGITASRTLRHGVLFTATGTISWSDSAVDS